MLQANFFRFQQMRVFKNSQNYIMFIQKTLYLILNWINNNKFANVQSLIINYHNLQKKVNIISQIYFTHFMLMAILNHISNIQKQVMLKLLKRTLLNIIVLSKNGTPSLYKEQYEKQQLKLKQASLEQTATFLNSKTNLSFLICRIAQTDYDLIQFVGDLSRQDFPEQFQKGINKLFQKIFYDQYFYKVKVLRKILEQICNDSRIDVQNIIQSSCELNQGIEQLQLKPYYQFNMNQFCFIELFGTALANELNQLKSTLTSKRLAILKVIVCDIEQQTLQQNLEQLQVQQEQGLIKNISQLLEDYSVYINLVYLCNNHLKNKNANLPPYLSAISQICLQILQDINLTQTSNSIYEIFAKQLDETLCFNSFQVESDAQRAYRSQIKRQYYQQKLTIQDQDLAIKLQRLQLN
ncbi:unnamed protein product [Paramecium pentaurelia]|uniref:Uncharacterized protein n=1 Tax=Paramecium pentaurelia TaxID=43138 RepID=A0A8S1XEW1_9CILI|nr:unnamed protein product [Paramecium pentaurelia]